MIFFRYVMIGLLIYIGIVGLYLLNTAFSNADKKKALEYLQNYHEGHTLDKDLGHFLKFKARGTDPVYLAVTDNTIFGIMAVKITLSEQTGEKYYLFKVDIVRNLIKPDSPETEQLLKEYSKWK